MIDRRVRRTGCQILGRNPALWLSAVSAALNALVLVGGWQLTVEQLAALNALAAAIIGLVANESDPSAMSVRAPTFVNRRNGPPPDGGQPPVAGD